MADTRIKIVTAFSGFGGSTYALIDLCNFFNACGLDCTLYGPDPWHLHQCPSGMHSDYAPDPSDRLIIHFQEVPARPCAHFTVVHCHEKHLFPIRQRNVCGCDAIVFVSESQRRWHDVDGVVIPNLRPRLTYVHKVTPENAGVAGVIGTIHPGKRTHDSIQAALQTGFERVLIYGNATEPYFSTYVQPLLSDQVVYKGVETDRLAMYRSVEAVFLKSESECASLVQQECFAFGIPFHGNENTMLGPVWSDERVLRGWRALLMLDDDWIDQTALSGNLGRQDSQYGWQTWLGKSVSNASILDVGAGLGLSRDRLAGNGNRVVLQDIAPGMPVDLDGPIQEIPANAYDYVTAFDVIEHVPDDRGFLCELARVSRRGLFISTPNDDVSHNQNPFHCREYSPRQMIELGRTLGNCEYFAGDPRGHEVHRMTESTFESHQFPHHALQWRKQSGSTDPR